MKKSYTTRLNIQQKKVHAELYKKALELLESKPDIEYYLCTVCGYIHENSAPEKCPICGAGTKAFKNAGYWSYRRHILESSYSLAEARILYEVGHSKCCTAGMLKKIIDIDQGYLSRVLKNSRRRSCCTGKNPPVTDAPIF